MLAEQHDEEAVVRRYMSSEGLANARHHIIDGEAERVTAHALGERQLEQTPKADIVAVRTPP